MMLGQNVKRVRYISRQTLGFAEKGHKVRFGYD